MTIYQLSLTPETHMYVLALNVALGEIKQNSLRGFNKGLENRINANVTFLSALHACQFPVAVSLLSRKIYSENCNWQQQQLKMQS